MVDPDEKRERGNLPSSQSLTSFPHLQKLSNQPKRFANASLKWLSMFTMNKPGSSTAPMTETSQVEVISSHEPRPHRTFFQRINVRPSQSVVTNLSK